MEGRGIGEAIIDRAELSSAAKHRPSKTFRVLDAFAGAGGFSLGFEQAGCKIVGAVELDSWASETFRANHPKATVFQRDIQNLKDDELTDAFGKSRPSILIGGPPCQGFSVCVRENGDPHDPRNSLFREFVRLARLFEPEVVVMENVPNIVKARTRSNQFVANIIQSELKALGYYVYSNILEAVNFGVPQIRKRFFVLGSKKPLECPFPVATHTWEGQADATPDLFPGTGRRCPTLWEAISDLPQLDAGEGDDALDYDKNPENEYQWAMRNGARVLRNHTAMRHGKRMVERFRAMGWGVPVSELPEHLRPRKRNSNEVADFVYDQNNRRLFPHRPCHTLPASFYANFVHPYCHRNFTPREGARIQSFPDTFIFKGKPTVCSHKLLAREGRVDELHLCQYSQIGNAVPPLMAKAIADNLLGQL